MKIKHKGEFVGNNNAHYTNRTNKIKQILNTNKEVQESSWAIGATAIAIQSTTEMKNSTK